MPPGPLLDPPRHYYYHSLHDYCSLHYSYHYYYYYYACRPRHATGTFARTRGSDAPAGKRTKKLRPRHRAALPPPGTT